MRVPLAVITLPVLIRSLHSSVSVRLVQLEEYVKQVYTIAVNYVLTFRLIFSLKLEKLYQF